MKRILNARGYAMLQAGTKTLEQLLADPNFSVEFKEGMKVKSVQLEAVDVLEPEAAAPAEAAQPPAAQTPAAESQATPTADLAAQLTTTTAALTTANEKIATLNAASAQAQADLAARTTELSTATTALTAANAELAVVKSQLEQLKAAAVTGVRSLQIALGVNSLATSATSVADLIAQHTDLAEKKRKALPTAQVSVAAEEEEHKPQAHAHPLRTSIRLSKKKV